MKHTGFYRVNYDETTWNLLIDQLATDHTLIKDPISRAQLIDDSFNLGRAEYVDQTIFLQMVKYLDKEENPQPFITAFNGLGTISGLIYDDYEAFDAFKVRF